MNDFKAFYDRVTDLWPRYKTNENELQPVYDRIGRHGIIAIGEALRDHKYDDPDAYKPNWRIVFSMLSESRASEVVDKPELQKLLNSERTRLRDNPKELKGQRPLEQWSDSDILEHRIIVATTACMRDAKGRRVDQQHPEFERRDRHRRHQEWYFRSALVQDLENRDEQVPEYLRCDMPDDMPDVKAYLKKINRQGSVDLKGVLKTVAPTPKQGISR